MRRKIQKWSVWMGLGVLFLTAGATPLPAQGEAEVPVEEFTLDNGMKFLLVQRPELTTVSAGWVARVGSANERPGMTGISHLFEHMMFKGTRHIGTKDIERDLQIIQEQEEIQTRIREIYAEQRARYRRGEIDDPFAPENRTPEQLELEERFNQLVQEQRDLMIKDEFDKIYTSEGASGMNAGTSEDFTVYFITVPANKLELWFWMESDRLLDPVFREFYSERDVVHEERRLRTESTPTGKFDEQFNAMFWESHPYSWPVVGWPSDLRVISKEEADGYFGTYYAPDNLTAALVGNFEIDEAKALAERYFGRLEPSPYPAPDVVTLEMPQLAEKRMVAECDCQPQTEVRYHTVPFMHVDSYPLDVLAGLLNGRTGRLYKSLIVDQEIASQAFSNQSSDKYAGSFSFFAETKGDATPGQLEDGWYAELQRIIDDPIPDEELQKVKNRIQADAFRRLENPFFLLLQLLIYDNNGDWQYLNTWADKTMAVTAEDVKRVASDYLTPDNRAVALYFRKEGAAAEEWPEFITALPQQQQQMVKQQIRQLQAIQDVAQLQQIAAQIAAQKGGAPPEFAPALDAIERWVQNRIAELSGQGGE
ncbi:MAG: pitrilysin family protein [Acidobacteriota bacterium]